MDTSTRRVNLNCPNCGNGLPVSLTDGLVYCETCQNPSDSCRYNLIMSAAWAVFHNRPETIDRIAKSLNLMTSEATLVEAFIMDSEYTPNEFRLALEELGIKKVYK